MAKIDEHIKVMMLKGETGANIKSIDKTATSGLVDTYTVTLTDGTKSSFTVTNGKDGKDGKDFDTFEIGGRNLLRGSKDFSGAVFRAPGATYSAETVSGADCAVMSFDNSAAGAGSSVAQWNVPGIGTAGTVYTLSFWFKGSGGSCVYFNGPEGSTQVSEAEVTINGTSKKSAHPLGRAFFIEPGSTVSEWTHCTIAYTLASQAGSTTTKSVLWQANAGATLSIALPMLERSAKPSDWTPAPEDKADVSAIVPKASVESWATASQSYAAGDYVVVGGALRKVKSAIAKGNTISDSNSTATTVTGEFASFVRIETKDPVHIIDKDDLYCFYTKRNGIVYLSITYVQGHTEDLMAITTKIPEGYRPISGFEAYFSLGHESNTEKNGVCKVLPDGTIETITSDNSAYYAGVVAYPAE